MELQILLATEDDLGEYQCEVNNGKSKSEQTIVVKEASMLYFVFFLFDI